MAAIQIISAKIGRTTGAGIAGNLRRFHPNWIVYMGIILLLIANTINLSADNGAMGEAVRVLAGGAPIAYVLAFGAICAVLQTFLACRRYVAILKWLTPALFAYVAGARAVHSAPVDRRRLPRARHSPIACKAISRLCGARLCSKR